MPKFLHFTILLTALLSISAAPCSSHRHCHRYGEALSKSLLYFEAQRSGRLPHNQRVLWRHHSGLSDGLEQGVDLVGGYYDAGDNVKFGLPMAFTVTMLSWGVIEYGGELAGAGEYGHALEAIKWGTDYFVKAHTHPNVLWVEVGDGESDHYCWQRPEDMMTSRRAHKIDEGHPGSEVAGETAAALAAASIVFKETNPHYSSLLLHHAQQLFEFGDKYRGRYDESVGVAKGYYTSVSGYEDELLWAALWLYRATGLELYSEYAVDNAVAFGGVTWAMQEFSWDVKYVGLQILASMVMKDEKQKKRVVEEYRGKSEHYVCACLNKNADATTNVRRTAGGLLYTRQWNNIQYASNAAFLLTLFADRLFADDRTVIDCPRGPVTRQEVAHVAKSQVDYILGSNPAAMSYLVGYGSNYPRKVHHRGASIESYKSNKGFIGCTQGYDSWYSRRDPNPNVLVGAVVGGPDLDDLFRDERWNYMQTEACTYNTAPLVGLFARLHNRSEEARHVTIFK